MPSSGVARIILSADEDNATKQVQTIAAAVREGAVILYPTATLYGLGGNGFDKNVAERIRVLKKRAETAFILLAADTGAALSLAKNIPPAAIDLAKKHWPGPLTLVLPASDTLPFEVQGPAGTVAIRVDAHIFTRRLAAKAGCPIISTSANISGRSPAVTADQLDVELIEKCDYLIIDDTPRAGQASTVVGFNDDGPVILRQGFIKGDEL